MPRLPSTRSQPAAGVSPPQGAPAFGILYVAFPLRCVHFAALRMKTKEKRPSKKGDAKVRSKRERLSLFPLSIEDALRAAAQTGRPPPPDKPKPKRRTVRKSP
jgi:hypothetical protein